MVVYIKRNYILNSDNVCSAKIMVNEKEEFTNKMKISFVGGENIEIEFSNVENCKKCLEHIASAIHGCSVHLFDGDEKETKLLYRNIHMVK